MVFLLKLWFSYPIIDCCITAQEGYVSGTIDTIVARLTTMICKIQNPVIVVQHAIWLANCPVLFGVQCFYLACSHIRVRTACLIAPTTYLLNQ